MRKIYLFISVLLFFFILTACTEAFAKEPLSEAREYLNSLLGEKQMEWGEVNKEHQEEIVSCDINLTSFTDKKKEIEAQANNLRDILNALDGFPLPQNQKND